MIIVAMVAVFIAALFLGLPIAVALVVSACMPHLVSPDFIADAAYIIRNALVGVDSFTLLALPLFMLSGDIMSKGGISKRLFNFFGILVGRFPGGMPCAVVLTCMFFGAISGSGNATCAAVGAMVLPLLINDLGYDKKFAGALLAVASGLAVIIPPSNPYVTICSVTGASIGDLMRAGIIPGIMMGVFMMVYVVVYCIRKGENREKIMTYYEGLHKKGFWPVLKDSFWALLFPVIILGSIYGGILTPTEAACISILYALIISVFVYKSVRLRDIPKFLQGAVNSYAPLIVLLCMANAFSRVLTLTGAADMLGNFLITHLNNRYIFLLGILIVMVVIGMFMDVGAANIILAPIFLPVAVELGINQIQFLLIMVCTLSVGYASPPFGTNLFISAPMVEETSFNIGTKALPMLCWDLVAILLIMYVPAISLFLL